MSGPQVKCEVNTCTHWYKGLCTAANIDILNEEEGRMSEIDAHTECKTFYKRSGVSSMLGSMDNVNWGGIATAAFKDGQQISPSVTCVVNSCTYWSDGNLCHAEGIVVTGHDANECQDTNCDTFKNKNQ